MWLFLSKSYLSIVQVQDKPHLILVRARISTATLLRIERGRVRRREIVGPMRLNYGVFKLQARRSS